MEQIINTSAAYADDSKTATSDAADLSNPSYQAFQILRVGFTVAPILAGADKFFHFLVDWDKYLPSVVNDLTGGNGHGLMLAVGLIEVIAGIGGGIKPRIFAYVVAAGL